MLASLKVWFLRLLDRFFSLFLPSAPFLFYQKEHFVFQVVNTQGGRGRGVELEKAAGTQKRSQIRLVRFVGLEMWTEERGEE